MRVNRIGKKRTFVIVLAFFSWILVILFQLFKVQVLEYSLYSRKIKAQNLRIMKLHSKRGTIYDRNGDILAISIKTKSAFISNKDNSLSEKVFRRLSPMLSLSYARKYKIGLRIKRGERFIWLKRKLSDEQYETLNSIEWNEEEKGILNFVDEYRRLYPQNRTASHVLGGVGVDEQPLGGVELSLNHEIEGQGGTIKALIDARKKIYHFNYIEEPMPGKDIHLTIDSSLQYIVEKELRRTVLGKVAKSGSIIVMDSRDGSVIAMASFPDYSPEEIAHASLNSMKNRAISMLYDPGSTFKIVLAAAALEHEACRTGQVFQCFNGSYHVRNRLITDVHPYEALSFEEIIVHSSNIGAARIGERVGAENMYEMISRFGFGTKTGIDLPGEEHGIVNPLSSWNEISLASISFGYELTVTPIQMARAFNVYATGGKLIKPGIVYSVGGEPVRNSMNRKILSASTLRQMLPILKRVVDQGTGKNAGIRGLEVAGKTGTAQKWQKGKYSSDHVSSFGGFFPVSHPRVTIFVVIDAPTGAYYGGEVAAPLFRDISEKILALIGIFPDKETLGRISS